ncbi:Carbon-nitrogen hydrolase [Orbilia oligospora]|uniref:Carbon-nitrogen hydrolase n=1 Tax=Orbilia oligospora TaxID=2813651 RepID=A0A7C8KS55_ORBOL|nr:Carbon-nitrogen hydrolase [Orbilia oligospora]
MSAECQSEHEYTAPERGLPPNPDAPSLKNSICPLTSLLTDRDITSPRAPKEFLERNLFLFVDEHREKVWDSRPEYWELLSNSMEAFLRRRQKIKSSAAGQFRAVASLTRNLESCRNIITKTVAAGAKILFLPEASDYIPISASESLKLVKPIETSEFVLGLQESAKQHKLPICVGIHEPVAGGEKVKNTCIYIDEDGVVRQRYQKLHMFDVELASGVVLTESRSVEPGKSITPPFDTPIGKLGMLICYDLRFPEISLQHRRLGAQIISYPSAFTLPTGNAGHWHTLLRARAIETQSYVIAPALVGVSNSKRKSYGHSIIVDPWGKVLGECKGVDTENAEDPGEAAGGEEDICVGEIDLGVLERLNNTWCPADALF